MKDMIALCPFNLCQERYFGSESGIMASTELPSTTANSCAASYGYFCYIYDETLIALNKSNIELSTRRWRNATTSVSFFHSISQDQRNYSLILLFTLLTLVFCRIYFTQPSSKLKRNSNSLKIRIRHRKRFWFLRWWESLHPVRHDPSHLNEAFKRKNEFLSRVGDDYGYKGSQLGYIDEWRPKEFPSLQIPVGYIDRKNFERNENNGGIEREVYLDYAGAALPMKSQLEKICRHATCNVFANPHSAGPAASRTAECIQRAERRVLKHLGGLPGRFSSLNLPESFYERQGIPEVSMNRRVMDRHPGYNLLFTSGATQAFKIIAERFPWTTPSHCSHCERDQYHSIFMYATNSHNSVVGMREVALQQGAIFHSLDLKDLEKMQTLKHWRILEDILLRQSDNSSKDCLHCRRDVTIKHRRHLLVFPSECNFGGVRPDTVAIIKMARQSGWYTMLDIAKHASTDKVSLNELNPDFCAVSFYKLFGEPTGVGGLMVNRSSVPVLFEDANDDLRGSINFNEKNRNPVPKRHYQGGGSVDIMLPTIDYTVPRNQGIGLSSLVSGTSHFRGIASLGYGFEALDAVGGMDAIHKHSTCLATELTRRLRELKHGNGLAVVKLYGVWGNAPVQETTSSGPTVAMNIFRSDGSAVGYNEVSKLASLNHPPLQFRTGCFCNPGACQKALEIDDEKAINNYEKNGHVCGDHIDLDVHGKPTGAIRVSFGKDSLWEDMDAFVQFVQSTFLNYHNLVKVTPTGKDVSGSCIDNAEFSSTESRVSVAELYLFPIKSCAGQRTSKWPIVMPSGKLRFDREFALVDTSGVALRLQKCPKLGLISPIIDLDTETMRISAPGCKDLLIRLSTDLYHGGENVVQVCGNKCGGRVWGDAVVSEWFSSFLGIQCWLARYSEGMTSSTASRPGFSNEQPILLVSESAVQTLNGVLQEQGQPTCSAKRFRPNLVIRDCSPFKRQQCHIEDTWKEITLNESENKRTQKIHFSVTGPCPRCTMVDYDPSSGIRKGKTLRALASYRRRHNGQIVFGIFLRATAMRNTNENTVSDQPDEAFQRPKTVWIKEGDVLQCR